MRRVWAVAGGEEKMSLTEIVAREAERRGTTEPAVRDPRERKERLMSLVRSMTPDEVERAMSALGASRLVAAEATEEAKARERAVLNMQEAWEALDSAKMSLQRAMRESGAKPQDMLEETRVVRLLEKMAYELSGMKRAVAGLGRK